MNNNYTKSTSKEKKNETIYANRMTQSKTKHIFTHFPSRRMNEKSSWFLLPVFVCSFRRVNLKEVSSYSFRKRRWWRELDCYEVSQWNCYEGFADSLRRLSWIQKVSLIYSKETTKCKKLYKYVLSYKKVVRKYKVNVQNNSH